MSKVIYIFSVWCCIYSSVCGRCWSATDLFIESPRVAWAAKVYVCRVWQVFFVDIAPRGWVYLGVTSYEFWLTKYGIKTGWRSYAMNFFSLWTTAQDHCVTVPETLKKCYRFWFRLAIFSFTLSAAWSASFKENLVIFWKLLVITTKTERH